MGSWSWLFHRGNDLSSQFLPDALFFKESILAGSFPIWNPWIMAGLPYLLDPQNFLWYPPNYILLFLPLELGFLGLLVGHLIWAGWWIGRVVEELLGRSGRWGILAAVMFVFSPKLVAHLEEGNWTLLVAACWLPALYHGLTKGLPLKGQSFLKRRHFWLVAISLAAIVINNLNLGYYSAIFALFYLVWWCLFKKGMILGRIILLGAVVGLMTLPRWLPLVVYGGQTVRASLSEPPLPFWSWRKILKSLTFPLTAGHPQLQNEEILYFGLATMMVMFVGAVKFFRGRPSRIQRSSLLSFWIVWLALVSLIAVNVKTPFFGLIKWLPGLALLRITTRPWIFICLAAAIFVPVVVRQVAQKSRPLAVAVVFLIWLEYGWFARGLFARREMPTHRVPTRFYEQMAAQGTPVRVYCTTGCLDRLTAQTQGIALLGGNNPVQLTELVDYLQEAGGYRESAYHPILPPYTVFNARPQPRAELLAETATKFVVSPYELTDRSLELVDQEGDYRLYLNRVAIMPFSDHHFSLSLPG